MWCLSSCSEKYIAVSADSCKVLHCTNCKICISNFQIAQAAPPLVHPTTWCFALLLQMLDFSTAEEVCNEFCSMIFNNTQQGIPGLEDFSLCLLPASLQCPCSVYEPEEITIKLLEWQFPSFVKFLLLRQQLVLLSLLPAFFTSWIWSWGQMAFWQSPQASNTSRGISEVAGMIVQLLQHWQSPMLHRQGTCTYTQA